jgi:hypothetical protein
MKMKPHSLAFSYQNLLSASRRLDYLIPPQGQASFMRDNVGDLLSLNNKQKSKSKVSEYVILAASI